MFLADEPQYRRGAGGNPANPPLPQGGATEANEAIPAEVPEEEFVEDEEVTNAATLASEESEATLAELARRGVFDTSLLPTQPYVPTTEEEQVLFNPAGSMPVEELPMRGGGTPPPPQGIEDWLPSLAALSRDPNAPPGVRALFKTIIDTLFPYQETNG